MEATHQKQLGDSQAQAHHHPLGGAKEEQPQPSIDPSRPMAAVDRTKRDEWSEGAVASLLDAYEAKWVLRNRAKLKGQDWEDVAHAVSARAGGGRSAKTATQCKNKVESMKKRYRSESATGNGSRWPLYARLDGLVRCRDPVTVATVVERLDHDQEHQMAPRPVALAHGSTLVAVPPELPKPNGEVAIASLLPLQGDGKEHNTTETNNDPACSARHSDESSSEEKRRSERSKKRPRRRSDNNSYMVMKSIQLFTDVALQVEQARIDAMREIETMRAQAEAKRSELDLKRTEIIASTQLKIAKLFARKYTDGADSSSEESRGS